MTTVPKKILIIGPSGSGKTYISAYLRALKVNAPDADQIEDLADWFDGQGKKVVCPPDADKDFLDNHEFLWNRKFLKSFLAKQNENIYLFGMAGNVFEMTDLFDTVYFLKASGSVLAERLRQEDRENPMGKTDYQLENALAWAKEIEEKAKTQGITMIEADQAPEKTFSIIK